MSRAPLGARGLKFDRARPITGPAPRRAPLGARGLKLKPLLARRLRETVALRLERVD